MISHVGKRSDVELYVDKHKKGTYRLSANGCVTVKHAAVPEGSVVSARFLPEYDGWSKVKGVTVVLEAGKVTRDLPDGTTYTTDALDLDEACSTRIGLTVGPREAAVGA